MATDSRGRNGRHPGIVRGFAWIELGSRVSLRIRRRLAVLLLLLLACAIVGPGSVWVFYKPMRVLAPTLNGVSCISERVCTDDPSRYGQAVKLYEEAYRFVDTSVGSMERKPRAVFCSSQKCFRSFGFDRTAANTVGNSGIVVGPNGWKDYYLRHEMIHHLQAERMGVLRQWLSPDWLTEGMAYILSEDPRPDLGEPLQEFRRRFRQWYRSVEPDRLWQEVADL